MKKFILIIMLLLSHFVYAQPSIQVVGLFKNKVLLVVDGKQKLLRVGQTFREVTLDFANSDKAVLSFNGVSKPYTLGSSNSFGARKTSKASFSVALDASGSYKTPGSINGKVVDFIVDTGATTVSINSVVAKWLGIDYKSGKEVNVTTASSQVIGYQVTLDKISLGSIRLTGIEATVLEGEHPAIALLGMSFLKHLKVLNENGMMHLTQK